MLGAKLGVVGQSGVIGSADKALDESPGQIAHVSVARVHMQHRGMVATRLRVPWRLTHDLCPVCSQPFDVLWVLPGMRKRVVQLRVPQTPRVVAVARARKAASPPANSNSVGRMTQASHNELGSHSTHVRSGTGREIYFPIASAQRTQC